MTHRAIVFRDHREVPNESSGYFTDPKTPGRATVEAAKGRDGLWWTENGPIAPQDHWVFTANTGPANDAALRKSVISELTLAELQIAPEDAGLILSCLWEKITDVESYLLGYRGVKPGPSPEDECCDFHRMRFQARVDQRAALKTQKKRLTALVRRFEQLEKVELTAPDDPIVDAADQAIRQARLEAIADQVRWDEHDSARLTESQLIDLLRQAAQECTSS